jgi:uncharacterized protein involved in type VI secretion and phage assembly
MAGYQQEPHLLRIDTVLTNPTQDATGGDPLLLVKLDGVEGISRLFAYDVVMLRDAGGMGGQALPPLDATTLIGTHVTVSGRPNINDIWGKRVGMFETFEDILGIDITHFGGNARDFHIYRARIVPWIKVLSRDICYRVFEGKTVVQIIENVLDEVKKIYPHILYDSKRLANAQPPFPKMDYCVQFGESTLDFLFRIMARFGIWFYFGHQGGQPTYVLNETLVLKGSWDQTVDHVGIYDITIVDESPNKNNISRVVRRYRPPERRVAIGGFNYLDPTNPYYAEGSVDEKDDLLKNTPTPTTQTQFAGSTSFAQPVFSQLDANAMGTTAKSENQSQVLLLSGATVNQTFASGYCFKLQEPYKRDSNNNLQQPYNDLMNKEFVIESMSISANDFTYINLPVLGSQTAAAVFSAVFNTLHSLDAEALDMTNNSLRKTSLWATRTAESKIYPPINRTASLDAVNPPSGAYWAERGSDGDPPVDPTNPPPPEALFWSPEVNVANYIDIPTLAKWGSKFLPFTPSMSELRQAYINYENLQTFAVGVVAVPAMVKEAAAEPVNLPLPVARRPVARGPHTAVVIGEDGTDTKKHDIYCDALGRVRVRFPWDPGPPESDSKIPPVFPFKQPEKPTKVGQNTCWVRVVEGWAGRHYGTQFLPRIGQEVLVDFLDGDPERPVITGRLYNADHVTTNIPFPDASQEKTKLEDLSKIPTAHDPPLSGIKTWSIPTTDASKDPPAPLPARFNLLRFSDKRDEEQYLIRAQHRLDITAFDSRYETIHLDRHMTVGGLKLTPPPKEIWGDYISKIYRNYYLHIGDPRFPTESGNRVTLIEQSDEINIQKDREKLYSGTLPQS